jgi:hypothetical protein
MFNIDHGLLICVRFQVFTASSIKFETYCDIALCRLVKKTDISEIRTASIIALIMSD